VRKLTDSEKQSVATVAGLVGFWFVWYGLKNPEALKPADGLTVFDYVMIFAVVGVIGWLIPKAIHWLVYVLLPDGKIKTALLRVRKSEALDGQDTSDTQR
jgi:hypothetical protein